MTANYHETDAERDEADRWANVALGHFSYTVQRELQEFWAGKVREAYLKGLADGRRAASHLEVAPPDPALRSADLPTPESAVRSSTPESAVQAAETSATPFLATRDRSQLRRLHIICDAKGSTFWDSAQQIKSYAESRDLGWQVATGTPEDPLPGQLSVVLNLHYRPGLCVKLGLPHGPRLVTWMDCGPECSEEVFERACRVSDCVLHSNLLHFKARGRRNRQFYLPKYLPKGCSQDYHQWDLRCRQLFDLLGHVAAGNFPPEWNISGAGPRLESPRPDNQTRVVHAKPKGAQSAEDQRNATPEV